MDSASSSPTEPEGFRLERRLGERTWLAEQIGLGRQVVLRRLDDDSGFDANRWPDRPGVVSLFAVVPAPDGVYLATQYLQGARTLAEVRRPRRRWLDQAERALDGTVHGRLSPKDILIDAQGTVLVTGFGFAPPGAGAAGDRAVLAALRPPNRGLRIVGTAAAVTAAGVAVVAMLAGGDAPVPPVTKGTIALGSALSDGDAVTLDCEGRPPSGGSLPCTVLLEALPGRPATMPYDGLIKGWAVRGARGRIGLQVVRPLGGGRYVAYNRSQPVVADPGRVRVFRAQRTAPKGARFAIEVYPGSAVGVRRGVSGAITGRFSNPLRSYPRVPHRSPGQELLLRVDVVRHRIIESSPPEPAGRVRDGRTPAKG